MMIKRRPRRRQTQFAFESITIEGGLLSPEWLSKIGQQQAPGQSDTEYRIPKGLSLRDEVGRYWRIAQALWAEFQLGLSESGETYIPAQRFAAALLTDVLGFTELSLCTAQLADDNPLASVSFGIRDRVPVAIAAADEALDAPSARFSAASRRRSAFGVTQECLNIKRYGFWGLATNGVRLRLLRENGSLTRPAWIEVDLERLFSEDRYADFVVLWLLLHASRFRGSSSAPDDCWLECWRNAGRDEGVRAREDLRIGVEAALVALGDGFISHRDNSELRKALENGSLTTQAYFAQLLRLVYRVIFLLTLEERELLHPSDALASSIRFYEQGYSLRSLRERASRRIARDRFDDLWEALKIVFRAAGTGEARLALPALGGLFAPEQCPTLDSSKIENRSLLDAIFRLSWLREESGLARVNWRDMGPEEFGSIYESLLELLPQISIAERRFYFASRGEAKGNTRKLTSSYYTNDMLVQTLLDAAIDPLIERTIAANPQAPATALLNVTVVDPACGSGHFLLGAARRIAAKIAYLQSGGTPSVFEYREALRQVISHSLYGVDRNRMAVELCKTALWLEGIVPGRPLSFLDSHIRCGDALLGVFDLSILEDGIPESAFDAREGDDKTVAATLRRKNKHRLKSLRELPLFETVAASAHSVETLPEETLEQVVIKERALAAAELDPSMIAAKLRADMFCAAFFSRKTTTMESSVPLTADLDKIRNGEVAPAPVIAAAQDAASKHNFFHWPLAFPDVFARGGFDLVIGNPPWKPMSPDEKEWFAPFDPAVREMALEARTQRIEELLAAPGMRQAWELYCQALYDAGAFIKSSGRFRLFAEGNLGKGDFNVYRMFVETALGAIRPGGVAAQIVPENLYNGANAAAIRAALFNDYKLCTLWAFENTKKTWFPAIDSRAKFCLYVALRHGSTKAFDAAFSINSVAKLAEVRAGNTIEYPVAQVVEFSPEALAIAEVVHPNDISIAEKLYAKFPKFGASVPGLAQRQYMREIDMGNDREDFKNDPNGVALFEGRMIEAYDYRAKAYVSGRLRKAVWADLSFDSPAKLVTPQWRIPVADLPEKLASRWRQYRVAFCKVSSVTNQRYLMAAIIPPIGVCGDSVPTIIFEPNDNRLMCLWLGAANSMCIDYLARKKGSNNMTHTVMDSLPLPRIYSATAVEEAIATRSLRLAASGVEMRSFWNATAPMFNIDPQATSPAEDLFERDQIRAEIDVLVARDVFGLSRDEMRYVLDPSDILGPDCGIESFAALKRAEERLYKEFRTRRLILETWDSMPEPASFAPLAASG